MEKWLKMMLKKIRLNESTLSMLLGALVVVVIGVLIFNYFSKTGQEGVIVEDGLELTNQIPAEGSLPDGLPTVHQVAQGENLWQVAEEYYGSGYNWVDIAEANDLNNANILLIGQELTIPQVTVKKTTVKAQPQPGSTYTVEAGDHLWSIAVQAYGDGYRWVDIAEANGLTQPDYINAGQQLNIPAGK